MTQLKNVLIFCIFSMNFIFGMSAVAFTPTDDTERLSGFAEHQKKKNAFNESRKASYGDYLDEQNDWAEKRKRDLEEYRKHRKVSKVMDEKSPEYQDWAEEKQQQQADYEVLRKRESAERKAWKAQKKKVFPLSEEEELDVYSSRDRFEHKKRLLYGANVKIGKWKYGPHGPVGSSSGSGSGKSGNILGGGGGAITPTDDFGGSGGFVPPPMIPDQFNDGFNTSPEFGGGGPVPGMDYPSNELIPPPPPPPPPIMDDGFGFGE